MLFRLSLVLITLVSCSEYQMGPKDGITPTPEDDTDTAVTPACVSPTPAAYTVARNEDCRDEPDIGTFTPVVEWAWRANATHPNYHQIMMTPVVTHLNSDVIPDVLAIAYRSNQYSKNGTVIGLSGVDGALLFSWANINGCTPYGTAGLAVGDLDGDGVDSIVFLTSCGLMAVDPNGTEEWRVSLPTEAVQTYLWTPSIADLDADGQAEVVFGRNVISSGGVLLWHGTGGHGLGTSFAADLDGDGIMEVIAGSTVYESDGSVRWDGGVSSYSGVADLDLDGQPEIVTVSYEGTVTVFSAGGVVEWTVDFPTDSRAGPPTLADFDGDGLPEIGIAFISSYRVLDGDGTILWAQDTEDDSSGRTGSAVFDFEGDGAAEVVYADEHVLYIFDGATGTVEMAYEDHESGTLLEYPIIVDIDGDGSAEIVLASNNMWEPSGITGITVIGDVDSSWAAARQVWNQHAYHITNVEDDGSIPTTPVQSWTANNSFRAGNSETAVGLDRADLHPGEPDWCVDDCEMGHAVLYFPVENGGLVDTGAVSVALYSVDETGSETLFDVWELAVLVEGEAAWIGPIELPIEAFGAGGAVFSVDDDGAGLGAHDECEEGNNLFEMAAHPCED
jgi:hypothetical protein